MPGLVAWWTGNERGTVPKDVGESAILAAGDDVACLYANACAEDDGDTCRLLSRDLLDELGVSGCDARDDIAGIDGSTRGGMCSSSDAEAVITGSPALTGTTNHSPSLQPWEWKADAQEFIPPSAGMGQFLPPSHFGAGTTAGCATGVSQGFELSTWMASCAMMPAWGAEGHEAESEEQVLQFREHLEWEVQRQDEEARELRQKLVRLQQRRNDLKRDSDCERAGLLREIERYASVFTHYSIPLEEAAIDEASPDEAMQRHSVLRSPSTMPSQHFAGAKCESLVRQRKDGAEGARAIAEMDAMSCDPAAGGALPPAAIACTLQSMFPHATVRTEPWAEASLEEVGAAPGLEFMMLKAEARPGSGGGAAIVGVALLAEAGGHSSDFARRSGSFENEEVRSAAGQLEKLCDSRVDDRALSALEALDPGDALEVLRKVDDLVRQQGGQCRNLSSILQSVCRKAERKSAGRAPAAGGGAEAAAASGSAAPDAPQRVAEGAAAPGVHASVVGAAGQDAPGLGEASGRRRRSQSDAEADSDVVDCAGFAWRGAVAAVSATGTSTSRSGDAASDAGSEEGADARRRRRRRRGREDSPEGYRDDGEEYWTPCRMEPVAQKGFELKRAGDGRWELRLCMAGVEPPLTEAAVEVYCAWLRERLKSFRDEHGVQPLRRCQGEVDFSNNGMTDQAVWTVLETLAQCEVQAASLKFYKNRISEGGVLALCEFIRANRRAGAIYEMHLSHNEIDDDSAYELIRTLKEQMPRYPPRRIVEGGSEAGRQLPTAVPVWVRLNQNRIQDPIGTLRLLEAEGMTFCAARNAHGCGPGKCSRPDCPLVHLYLFADQAQRRGGRERVRQRDRDRRLSGDGDFEVEEPQGAERHSAPVGAAVAHSADCAPPAPAAADSDGGEPADGAAAAATTSRRKRGRKARQRQAGPEGGEAETPAEPAAGGACAAERSASPPRGPGSGGAGASRRGGRL